MVLGLICRLSWGLAFVLAKVGQDGLLAEGVTSREVKQFPVVRSLLCLSPWTSASLVVPEMKAPITSASMMSGSSLRCSEKAADIFTESFSSLLFAGLEVPEVTGAHVYILKISYEDALEIGP